MDGDDDDDDDGCCCLPLQPVKSVSKPKGSSGAALRDQIREKYGFKKKPKPEPTRRTGNTQMDRNLKLAHQRGEALNQTGDAAEEMANEAAQLGSIAHQLKMKQKNRNFFGF